MSNIYKLLSCFERDGKEETPGTPVSLVNDMLDKLPSETWSDPSKKFLDPACSTGTFLLEIVRRLNKGLAQKIPNQEDRLRHIVENMVYGAEVYRVPYLMTRRAFSRLFNYKFNLFHGNMVEGIEGLSSMKFDVVVMNPPYQAPQEAKGKRGSGDSLWNKFVEKALSEWATEGGLVVAVHPSGWRKPATPRSQYRGMFKLMAHDYHMKYLEIHDSSDGMRTFGAGTRYDWYLIDKESSGGETIIKDQNGQESCVSLQNYDWLPNHSLEQVYSLFSQNKKQPTFFSCDYHTQNKSYLKPDQDSTFCFPLVHSTPKKGNRFWYSSRNDKGHFGIPKVIFGESGIGDVIVDIKGEYGMTQGAMGLPVVDETDAQKAKEYLMSDEFQNILDACSWSNFRVDWRMFTYFKEGFWR